MNSDSKKYRILLVSQRNKFSGAYNQECSRMKPYTITCEPLTAFEIGKNRFLWMIERKHRIAVLGMKS
jgi:hypothetical protein